MLFPSLWTTEGMKHAKHEALKYAPESRGETQPPSYVAATPECRLALQNDLHPWVNSNSQSAHRRLKDPRFVNAIGLPLGDMAAGCRFPKN